MGIERGSLEKRFDEYRKHDAIWLAGLIAKREISAEEVLEAAIARAEQVNPPGGFDQRHQHISRAVAERYRLAVGEQLAAMRKDAVVAKLDDRRRADWRTMI